MDISSLRDRSDNRGFTVSELNKYVKSLFDSNRALASVTVRGEISNFTSHRSGHLYFSLKDDGGQIKSVMFRSSAAGLRFIPKDGMRVIAHGSVNVYERDGVYQLYVTALQPDGVGALYLAYEQLKEKLHREGLFDPIHKKSIPRFPEKIGVITSPTGAAIRDIVNVLNRRFPVADIYLYPTLVQGENAEESLISGVDYFDRSGLCDVVIIGRGGGSIEDLWAFNGERLARRIFESRVPIISAVGHETDFTICDFVSDLRAPTPSAAAELATPDVTELMMRLDSYEDRARLSVERRVASARESLEYLANYVRRQALYDTIDKKKKDIDHMHRNALASVTAMLERIRSNYAVNAEKLNALSPLSVISRGYSLAVGTHGIVSSIKDVNVGDAISVRVSDGLIAATVNDAKEVMGR